MRTYHTTHKIIYPNYLFINLKISLLVNTITESTKELIMAKTVLTLDEINLLKNSEEPKDENLYGNLYTVICNLKNPKAISLECMPSLNNIGRVALTRNKKTLMENVIKEWYAERVSEEDPNKKVHCGLCNTPNKYLYYIRNRKNNTLLNVGSHCITKFPGLEGYIEQKQQLNEIFKGHQVVARRNEFYDKFPKAEDTIADAEKFFSTFPILLPYKLYTDLQDTIKRMRLIYAKYVQEGKKPYNSNYSSFELFEIALKQYQTIQMDAISFLQKNQNNPLICRRPEINWLLTNNKDKLLREISENNGVYTETTLRHITSFDFVRKQSHNIFARNTSEIVEFIKIDDSGIYIQIKKIGYSQNLIFRMSIERFMSIIGAKYIINSLERYNLEQYLSNATILISTPNIESVLNYIYNFTRKTIYVFLFDEMRNNIILYRRNDSAVRIFRADSFLKAYATHILKGDDVLKRHVENIVNNKNIHWITKEMQAKQGIDDIIHNLYKEQTIII